MTETIIYWDSFTYKHWKVNLAATNNGLCFLGTHHSSYDDLVIWCKKQFPNSRILENSSQLLPYEEELVEYFEGKRKKFTFSFDIRGTSFQMDVWDALNQIPYGQTKCYSDIAHMIGNPKAVRAVGTAVGKNPLSIIIPCHRVLGKNGTLTGYSGGLDVKELLLQHEGIPYKK